MTRSHLVRALLLSSMAAVALGSVASADTQKIRQLSVRNAAQIQGAFNLAAAERGRQAVEISCSPASSEWCATGFVAACDKAKGGMSTGPDGGVTCSLPQHN